MRAIDTPELQATTVTIVKYSVEKFNVEKGSFEGADMLVTDSDISLPDSQYRMHQIQEMKICNDCCTEIIFKDGPRLQIKFASAVKQFEAQSDMKRLHQVALDNRLIEEAEEVLADYEESKAIP